MNRSVLVVDTPMHCLGCVFRTMNLQHQFICLADGRVIKNINIRDPECILVEIPEKEDSNCYPDGYDRRRR